MCCYGAGLGEGKGGIVGNKVGIGGWFTNVNVLVEGESGFVFFVMLLLQSSLLLPQLACQCAGSYANCRTSPVWRSLVKIGGRDGVGLSFIISAV